MRLELSNEERDLLLTALASLQMVSESSAQYWRETKMADEVTKVRRLEKEIRQIRQIELLTQKLQHLRG
jgi:hypothetical protein